MDDQKKFFQCLLLTLLSFLLSTDLFASQCRPLEQWLNSKPNVAKAIVWNESGIEKNWQSWPASDRKLLRQSYEIACKTARTDQISIYNLPEVIQNQIKMKDQEFATTAYSLDDAKRLYLASVASNLNLEINRQLKWSIAEDPANSLEVLFHVRHFFRWDAATRLYLLEEDLNGLVGLAPPDLILRYLTENELIGKTRKETIIRFLEWCSNLHHDFSTQEFVRKGFSRETAIFMESFWQSRGFPPVMRVLIGTKQTIDATDLTEKIHWTAGCWGTTGLIKIVLRVLNIPVSVESYQGHAFPHFLSEKLLLSHGDDPYNQLFSTLPKPLPTEKLLLPELSSIVPKYKIGSGVTKFVLETIPGILIVAHKLDLHDHLSQENSRVFGLLKSDFSIDELRRNHLWERIEKKL